MRVCNEECVTHLGHVLGHLDHGLRQRALQLLGLPTRLTLPGVEARRVQAEPHANVGAVHVRKELLGEDVQQYIHRLLPGVREVVCLEVVVEQLDVVVRLEPVHVEVLRRA
jgi:hypothetical protein